MQSRKLPAIAAAWLLLLLTQDTALGQTARVQTHSFRVCDVKKSKRLLQASPFREVMLRSVIVERDRKEEENWSRGYSKRLIEALPKDQPDMIGAEFHPFVAAVHTAYAEHYPLTISPDMIWLLITQGFAMHINQHPEEMRRYFVDFQGKKNLDIRRDDFVKGSPDNDWEGAFNEFSQLIEQNTGKGLLDLVTSEFSTTTPVEKAAFQVTLMDAMKNYFSYSSTTMCGIPRITLEGSVADWESIERKAQELAHYDLQSWIEVLMPILQEFTRAAKGQPDKEFWRSIYKIDSGCGSPTVNGWILNFFPYKAIDGVVQPFAIKRKYYTDSNGKQLPMEAGTDEFPSGFSKADILWNYLGKFYKMELLAGFTGFRQDPQTLSLRPVISWAVVDRQEAPTQQEIEDYMKGGDEKYRNGQQKQ